MGAPDASGASEGRAGEIALVPGTLPPGTLAELEGRAERYFRSARAPNTIKAYRHDVLDFEVWCKVDAGGLLPLPAAPATVALYLADLAGRGRGHPSRGARGRRPRSPRASPGRRVGAIDRGRLREPLSVGRGPRGVAAGRHRGDRLFRRRPGALPAGERRRGPGGRAPEEARPAPLGQVRPDRRGTSGEGRAGRHRHRRGEGISLVGAAYLAYLAVVTWRAAGSATVGAGLEGGEGYRRIFWRGVVVNLTNPKIILFFAAFLTQFVDPARGSVALQFLTLGLIVQVAGLAVDAAMGFAAGSVRDVFARRPGLHALLDRVAASVLAAALLVEVFL